MDLAWRRNIDILMSYNVEMMLKAAFVILNDFKDRQHLNKELQNIGHNLKTAKQKIGKLESINIKDIMKTKNGYKISTLEGEIYVRDFKEIRYSFIDGKIITLKEDEVDKMKKSLDETIKVIKKIKLLKQRL
jgi:hypothetical protein